MEAGAAFDRVSNYNIMDRQTPNLCLVVTASGDVRATRICNLLDRPATSPHFTLAVTRSDILGYLDPVPASINRLVILASAPVQRPPPHATGRINTGILTVNLDTGETSVRMDINQQKATHDDDASSTRNEMQRK